MRKRSREEEAGAGGGTQGGDRRNSGSECERALCFSSCSVRTPGSVPLILNGKAGRAGQNKHTHRHTQRRRDVDWVTTTAGSHLAPTLLALIISFHLVPLSYTVPELLSILVHAHTHTWYGELASS